MITEDGARARELAALLDAVDDMETDDPRFEQAVTRHVLCYVAASGSEREEAQRLCDEALETRSTDALRRISGRLKDEERNRRIQQICIKLGVALGSSIFGRRR